MKKDIPFFAIGNGELEDNPKVGEFAKCPKCGKEHKVKYGTSNGKKNKTVGFVNCGKHIYLVAIEGKLL